ncbi:YniB family protein [Bisgaard Taxon 10/6]|uniref:YniB family protein n=1 Tax=Exercitatus varius TaxID=67857 RepID=UPI00294B4F46|nr:YniB family protein [Exercitatus varius]MDG2959833.1 YniB family protein [Exercitatus varius]
MMLFREKKKAWWKIIVGFFGGIICLILLMMSWLKMIYVLPNIEILSRPIKKLINGIYNKTSFLDPLWQYAPIPNIDNLLSKEFVLFFIISVIFVIFMILMNSGKLQLRKLNKIEQKIQDQILEESIKGNLARSREEIERDVWLPEQSLLASFHALYIAPLIVGIILIFLEKFL